MKAGANRRRLMKRLNPIPTIQTSKEHEQSLSIQLNSVSTKQTIIINPSKFCR